MNQKINLLNGDIQHSNLFLHMPLFDEITYEGFLTGKVRQYRAIREEQPCQFLVLNVIRQDEDVIWDALEDMLKRAVSTAALGAHGVYTFDLLTIDIHKEIKTFDLNELATTLIRHTEKCPPGAVRLVKYSSAYGLLQKLLHESWGKITFKSAVEVFKDKDMYLDLLIKQLLKNFEYANLPSILLLNDLSQNPIFNAEDQDQQQRLAKLIEAQIPTSIEFVPEVYIQDKNCVRELLSGSIIK